MDKVNALLNALRDVLQGEPLRAISYGSTVVIFLVAGISGKFGEVSFEQAITASAAAVTIVGSITEAARNFVYSPLSVIAIAAGAPVGAVPGAVPDAGNPDK